MRRLKYLLLLSLVWGFGGCDDPIPEPGSDPKLDFTVGVESVTATTVKVKGEVKGDLVAEIRVGVYYSTDKEEVESHSAKSMSVTLSEGNYSSIIKGLLFDTDYYYCAYAVMDGKTFYSKVQNFSTEDVSLTCKLQEKGYDYVSFSGAIEGLSPEDDGLEFCLLYSKEKELTLEKSQIVHLDYDQDWKYAVTVEGLEQGSEYTYGYSVVQGEKREIVKAGTFTTEKAQTEFDLSVESVTVTTAGIQCEIQSAIPETEAGLYLSDDRTEVSSRTGRKIVFDKKGDDGCYHYLSDELVFDTEYYYCAYAVVNGETLYSGVKEFSTDDVTVTCELDEIGYDYASFSGAIEGLSPEDDGLEFCLLYSREKELTLEKSQIVRLDYDQDWKYAVTVEGLEQGSEYTFGYSVVQGEKIRVVVSDSFAFEPSVPEITLSVDYVKATRLKILGQTKNAYPGMKTGLFVSSDKSAVESRTCEPYHPDLNADGSFVVYLYDLDYATEYWCCAYAEWEDKIVYMDLFSFSTADVILSAKIKEIPYSYTRVNASGRLDGMDYMCHKLIDVSFVYSVNEDLSQGEEIPLEFISSDYYDITLDGLTHGTTYNYGYCIRQSDREEWRRLGTFVTKTDVYADSWSDMEISDSEYIAIDGPANCHIVSKPGQYMFMAVKGNSTEYVGDVASASVLWETYGTSESVTPYSLVRAVCCKNGYVIFKTADEFREGNAVIAVRDKYGTILWSWHLWFVEDEIGKQVYGDNVGVMLDRNLGAVSAVPGDVGALGLLYQWGRKDPFLGSSSISAPVQAVSSVEWPSDVLSSSGEIGNEEYAVQHPMTYIRRNTYNYDWYYTGTAVSDWSRWASGKTIYDPCPAGWRVPDGGPEDIWAESGLSRTAVYDPECHGFRFNVKGGQAWYPLAGQIAPVSCELIDAGEECSYFSVTPFRDYFVSVMTFYSSGGCYENIGSDKGGARPIRCCRE